MITTSALDSHRGLVIATHEDMVEQRKYALKVGSDGNWSVYYGPECFGFSDLIVSRRTLDDPAKARRLFAMTDEAFARFES